MTTMTTKAWRRLARFVETTRRKKLSGTNDDKSVSVSSKPNGSENQRADAPETTDAAGLIVYGEFIKDELEAQDKRKASFEQRGLAVITTSGALVTLLFALAALSTKSATTFTLPQEARTWLYAALVLFFVSALAALLANAPLIYEAVPAEKIRERVERKPPPSAAAATKAIALGRINALESAKRLNGYKGWSLTAAMSFEALAVGCVAVAVGHIL